MWKIFLPFVLVLILLTWATGLVIFWRHLRERWRRQAAEERRRVEREAMESLQRLSAGVYAEPVSEIENMQGRKTASKSDTISG